VDVESLDIASYSSLMEKGIGIENGGEGERGGTSLSPPRLK